MMTVEAERPTAVGSPVTNGSLSSRCCHTPLSPGREDDPPASPVSSAGSSASDTSIHVDPTEATLTVSVVHTSSRPPSVAAAASPPPSPASPESERRSPDPVSIQKQENHPAPTDRGSPASPAGSSPGEGRQKPAVVPVVLPTPVKLTNFSIDAILKPSFGNATVPSVASKASSKASSKARPLDVVNLIKGNINNKSSTNTTKHNTHNNPHGIDHIVHGHKYLMQRSNGHQHQQPQHHPSQQHHPHFLSRSLHHSHRSSFSPYQAQSNSPHHAHTTHHHHHPRSPSTTTPTVPGRFIYPSPAVRDSSSPPTNNTKSSRHHPYSHHHHHQHLNHHHHHHNPHHHQQQTHHPQTETSTTSTTPGSRSPGVSSSSSSSSTGPTSPGGCSSVSVTSSSGGSPTYKSSTASQNNSEAHSLHSPGTPLQSRTSQATSGGSPRSEPPSAEGKDPMVWPAWVYCTRYSDRPSSGPRARKLKKCKDKKVEEKRPRTAFTNEQLARLKKEFDENRYLTEVRRQDLAKELGLNESQIKIWFQNKRAKMKKASGVRNGLAIQLMAQGLYNHSTVGNEESDDQSITGGIN